MSSINSIIQEAIDVRMMDVKNITSIIESYYTFNFIDFDDYNIIEETKDKEDEYTVQKLFLIKRELCDNDNVNFLLLKRYLYIPFRFINGNIFKCFKNEDGSIRYDHWEYLNKNYEKYFIKEDGYDELGKYYSVYNIENIFKNKEAFIKDYKRYIESLQNLFKLEIVEASEYSFCFNDIEIEDNTNKKIKFLFD